ncbi:MAG: aquaporin family protein, partial [Phycisphaerales bacterium]|nr:aquaporin family protein [Phycisphaerales bacterium]
MTQTQTAQPSAPLTQPVQPAIADARPLSLAQAIKTHWPLYLIEGFLLACFMISASAATILFMGAHSPVAHAVTSPWLRRIGIGIAMGGTAVLLIYCPWGKRSGAHMNPAFTLSFLWLKRIAPADALGYAVGQFAGGALGVLAAVAMFGNAKMSQPTVDYVVTIPGPWGVGVAWLGEFAIGFILIAAVLLLNRSPKLAPRTGLACGVLIALFVVFEAPLSGFSMNPARTFGSAVVADVWQAWWIYFSAPILGMLTGVEVHKQIV